MRHSRYSRVLARCRHIKAPEPLTLAEREARRKLDAEAAGDLYLPSKAWLQAQQQQPQEGMAVFDPQTESLLEQVTIAQAQQQSTPPTPPVRDPEQVRAELGPTDQEHQSEAI